jgi:hypothetical protein
LENLTHFVGLISEETLPLGQEPHFLQVTEGKDLVSIWWLKKEGINNNQRYDDWTSELYTQRGGKPQTRNAISS